MGGSLVDGASLSSGRQPQIKTTALIGVQPRLLRHRRVDPVAGSAVLTTSVHALLYLAIPPAGRSQGAQQPEPAGHAPDAGKPPTPQTPPSRPSDHSDLRELSYPEAEQRP